MPIRVVTDSVASIPRDTVDELGMRVLTLFVNDGEQTMADLDIDLPTFYDRLADLEHIPTSSQPSVESFIDAFTQAVREGLAVVGVFISSKMSGTCETARMAADIVKQESPDAVIEIVDSRSNSMQEGFAAIAAAKAAKAGASVSEAVSAAVEATKRTRYLFTPHTLEYLKKGGRIGKASALLGGLLQIKPILTVEDGETTTFGKVRTTARALDEMARQFGEDVRQFGLADVVVHYIADEAAAKEYAARSIEPLAGRSVPVVPVSPVIGVHVGPAVAVCYQTERPLR